MICNESIIDRFPPLWNEMIQIKTSATPLQHPPNHYSCLLSIGTSWRYCCGRQAAVLFRYRCSSPLASTYKAYAGTYGVSVFYSADCSFRSFAGCLGPKTSASAGYKRHMAMRPHAVSFSPFLRGTFQTSQ